jgi:predicted DCC family thiol-disulfide oxidoreductase YuxK
VCYDGVCGLCNGFVLLRRDREGRLRFAPLQGEAARELLTPHQVDPADLDTIYVIAGWRTPHERALARSKGVLHAVRELGGPLASAARLASIVPSPVADAVYRLLASGRYRVFGKFDRCPAPPPDWRSRFLQ